MLEYLWWFSWVHFLPFILLWYLAPLWEIRYNSPIREWLVTLLLLLLFLSWLLQIQFSLLIRWSLRAWWDMIRSERIFFVRHFSESNIVSVSVSVLLWSNAVHFVYSLLNLRLQKGWSSFRAHVHEKNNVFYSICHTIIIISHPPFSPSTLQHLLTIKYNI